MAEAHGVESVVPGCASAEAARGQDTGTTGRDQRGFAGIKPPSALIPVFPKLDCLHYQLQMDTD